MPFHLNLGKRLGKSRKVNVRDSGLVHALLGIRTFNELAGHPVTGPVRVNRVLRPIVFL
jgi:hypothetical protein